jgi:ArsR family transcriptional regulator
MGMLKQAGFVIAERHGQWTFYRRDEDGIRAFLSTVQDELLKR